MMKGKTDDPYQLKRKQERNSRFQVKFGILPEVYQVISQQKKLMEDDDKENDMKGDLDVSQESLLSEEEDEGPNFENLIINSDGQAYTIWHEVVDFLCIISSFIYIHYAAYRHEDESQKWLMLVIECAFVLDFMMNFILDFPDPKDPMEKRNKDISEIS